MMLFARGIVPPSLPVDDKDVITPEALHTMTGGRIPATIPRGGVMTPEQYLDHVGSAFRPANRLHRADYLPPHPDRTKAQTLAALLMQSA